MINKNEKNLLLLKKDASFKGAINTNSNVIIMGEVSGEVATDRNLYILNSARIYSNVSAENIQINGLVEGNINAAGKIIINKEARVFGDIKCRSLRIQSGAIYCGDLEIIDGQQ